MNTSIKNKEFITHANTVFFCCDVILFFYILMLPVQFKLLYTDGIMKEPKIWIM